MPDLLSILRLLAESEPDAAGQAIGQLAQSMLVIVNVVEGLRLWLVGCLAANAIFMIWNGLQGRAIRRLERDLAYLKGAKDAPRNRHAVPDRP